MGLTFQPSVASTPEEASANILSPNYYQLLNFWSWRFPSSMIALFYVRKIHGNDSFRRFKTVSRSLVAWLRPTSWAQV